MRLTQIKQRWFTRHLFKEVIRHTRLRDDSGFRKTYTLPWYLRWGCQSCFGLQWMGRTWSPGETNYSMGKPFKIRVTVLKIINPTVWSMSPLEVIVHVSVQRERLTD